MDPSKEAARNKKKKKKPQVVLTGELLGTCPIEIATTTAKGRFCVASRDIKAGELVLLEPAFAWMVNQESRNDVCHHCCASTTHGGVPGCGACDSTWYCDSDCARKACVLHALECRALQQVDRVAKECDVDTGLLRIVLRLLAQDAVDRAMRKRAAAAAPAETVLEPCQLPRSSMDDVRGLVEHRDQFSEAYNAAVDKAFDALLPLIPETARVSASDAVGLACRVNVNAHGLEGPSGLAGFGVFPRVALLCHSCAPNCCFTAGSKATMMVRAVEDVAKGTELTVRYIDIYTPHGQRQVELQSTRYFTCKCARCAKGPAGDGNIDGVLCPSEGCGGLLQKTQVEFDTPEAAAAAAWECDKCGHAAPAGPLLKLITECGAMYEEAFRLGQAREHQKAWDKTQELIRKAHGLLHDEHVYMYNLYPIALNAARYLDEWSAAAKYCRMVLSCMNAHYPKYDLEKVNYYRCLGDILTESLRGDVTKGIRKRFLQERTEAYEAALEQAVVCYGEGAETVAELRTLLDAPAPGSAGSVPTRSRDMGGSYKQKFVGRGRKSAA